jgi:DNA polymerase III epsilon subunit family exonuclease
MSQLEFAPSFGVALRPAGSLVGTALKLLAAGPLATDQLAEQVLHLKGNPRAAAAAVFALLGNDPRLSVDREGVWSLATPEQRPYFGPLSAQEWVVVDVETTGGSVDHGHRLIEVAAVRVRAGEIRGTYSTLVNPGRPVPRMITSLTGISEEMVAGAPMFHEVVEQIEKELLGRVFVGHNAGFDWRFLDGEMERCRGMGLSGRRLCTLRLARRLAPHLPSRSLGALAHYYGITMDVHHRALDDAVATAHLLIRFLGEIEDQGVSTWTDLEAFLCRRRPGRKRKRSAFPRPMDAA